MSLTPPRRYQVFISSTFDDLKEERKAAIEAVVERGHIPIALDRFSPANASDLEVIKKAMSDSQVYLLILGHRYGQLIKDKDISFTEFEYDLAQEHNLMTLVFMLDKEVVRERRGKLDSNNKAEDAELQNYNRLVRFHEKISHHFRQIWTPGSHFKYMVEVAVADNLTSWDRPGFIREPDDPVLLEGARNPFVGDLVAELRSFKKLYSRCSDQPEKKYGLSRFFAEQYLDLIRSNKVSLFFESGSTVAFLAKELSVFLSGEVTITDSGAPSIQMSTNNVLAYLLLWLKARIPCTMFPWSPPVETTYGAAYGGLEKKLAALSPDYRQPPLNLTSRQEIERLLAAPYTLTAMKRPTLLLGAASGLQLSGNQHLRFPHDLPEARKEELRAQLSQCFGPHVGSYHNKVFKRFMYATRLPLMIFLTGDKIDCPIEVGKCHFILDSELTWQKFYAEYPVAFCVGCSGEEMDAQAGIFRSLGFEVMTEDGCSPITTFIARNAVFVREFEQPAGGQSWAASAG